MRMLGSSTFIFFGIALPLISEWPPRRSTIGVTFFEVVCDPALIGDFGFQ
jgi:hypothetical protein